MVGKVRVKVPGLYELLVMEDSIRGVLVGDNKELLYVPFPEGGLEGLLKREKPIDVSEEGFVVKEFPDTIWSVLTVDNVLYVGLKGSDEGKNFYKYGDGVWESLSIYCASGYYGFIGDIVRFGSKFGDRVVVGGYKQIFSDVDGNQLISFEEFESRYIGSVNSVVYAGEGGLFLDVKYYSEEHGLVRVVYEDGKFGLGEEILHYGIEHNYIYRTRFLGRSSDGSPLVISTVPLKYLVINGKEVVVSDVINNLANWHRLVVLRNNFDRRLVDVLVSGHEVGVEYMRINYKNPRTPEAVERFTIITGLTGHVSALAFVKDKELHNILLELKNKS